MATAVLGICAACSLVVDAERNQCSKDADCLGHTMANARCVTGVCISSAVTIDASDADAAPADPIWGCLGKAIPSVLEEPSVPVSYPLRFNNMLGGEPVADGPVVACKEDDIDCIHPLDGTTRSDANGDVMIPVYSGFRGYFQLSAPPDKPTFIPALIWAQPVPDKTKVLPAHLWSTVTKESLAVVAQVAGAEKPVKDEYGHLVFNANDCSGNAAEGIEVTHDVESSDTFMFYSDSQGAASSVQHATGKDGLGGVMNLPPGPVVLKLSRQSDGFVVRTQKFFVRAGTLSYAAIYPN